MDAIYEHDFEDKYHNLHSKLLNVHNQHHLHKQANLLL